MYVKSKKGIFRTQKIISIRIASLCFELGSLKIRSANNRSFEPKVR